MEYFMSEKVKQLVILAFAAFATILPILDRWLVPTVNGKDNFANLLAYVILATSPLVAVIGPLYFIDKKLLTKKTKWPILLFPLWIVLFVFVLPFLHQNSEYSERIFWIFAAPIFALAETSLFLLGVFYVGIAFVLPNAYLTLKHVEMQSTFKYYSWLTFYLCLNIVFMTVSWMAMFFE